MVSTHTPRQTLNQLRPTVTDDGRAQLQHPGACTGEKLEQAGRLKRLVTTNSRKRVAVNIRSSGPEILTVRVSEIADPSMGVGHTAGARRRTARRGVARDSSGLLSE
jgi:hypothetical protein